MISRSLIVSDDDRVRLWPADEMHVTMVGGARTAPTRTSCTGTSCNVNWYSCRWAARWKLSVAVAKESNEMRVKQAMGPTRVTAAVPTPSHPLQI
jgi:hypothetical protein